MVCKRLRFVLVRLASVSRHGDKDEAAALEDTDATRGPGPESGLDSTL